MNTIYPGYGFMVFKNHFSYYFQCLLKSVLYFALLLDLSDLQQCPVYTLVLYRIFTFSSDNY